MNPLLDRGAVRIRVQDIQAISGDDESAHSAEDELYRDVLRYYANGGTDPELAKEALKTLDLEFERWCA